MIKHQSLAGKLMIANPANPKGWFRQSVLLLISHTPELALAVQLNDDSMNVPISQVAERSGLIYNGEEQIRVGGNIATNKVHIIHTLDWYGTNTIPVTANIGVTSDVSILTALCANQGPEKFIACAGYWMWENQLLDQQLDPKIVPPEPHRWLTIPADENLIFDTAPTAQWHKGIEAATKYQVSLWF